MGGRVPVEYATQREARDFVLWAKQADKFVGAKQPAGRRLAVNRVTGKRTQTARYAPSTINHTLTAVQEFYTFHADEGRGPVRNPIPSGGRPYANHRPDRDFEPRRRASLRQKEPQRLPRAIPDEQFDELFRRMRSHRDRALLAFYVSSGARASELLGLTGDMVNYGDQLIGVIRKGGNSAVATGRTGRVRVAAALPARAGRRPARGAAGVADAARAGSGR